jgi:hypothetical protein
MSCQRLPAREARTFGTRRWLREVQFGQKRNKKGKKWQKGL